jgi:K+-transporting ATPase ATPase C chain
VAPADRAEVHQPGLLLAPSVSGANGAGAGGSNKSPTSEDLTRRATELIVQYGATPEKPLPPELVAASGGGLDPHISEHAARYQVEVAGARGLAPVAVEELIRQRSFLPGGWLTAERLVNVLELNLALDRVAPGAATRHAPAGSQPAMSR